MISSENRFPLCTNVALRVRIMLYAGTGHCTIDLVLVAAS
jgi:hypothetical protein